jgi:hypothetical protein
MNFMMSNISNDKLDSLTDLAANSNKIKKSNFNASEKINNYSYMHAHCDLLADQNSNSNSNCCSINGDQRTMDAADTLVSLANTPSTEFKPFISNSPQSPKLKNNNIEIVNYFLLISYKNFLKLLKFDYFSHSIVMVL